MIILDYVIFDLEWNNAYNYATKRGMNEIIEIGAVRLNENLNIIDTFKQIIKPKVSKKLTGRFKSLTNITNEDIEKEGIPFENAISDFKRWSSGDVVFMSWSNSDLYVLVDNFKRFLNTGDVDFIKKYADVQKYCQSFIDSEDNNQISLSNCADKFGITVDEDALHRALVDCYLSAECFKKVFNEEKFKGFVNETDNNFFARLVFKQYYIKVPECEGFNLHKVKIECPKCKSVVKILKKYDFVNNTFRSIASCEKCYKKYWVNVRAKQTYDGIVISAKAQTMNKKRAKKLANNANV